MIRDIRPFLLDRVKYEFWGFMFLETRKIKSPLNFDMASPTNVSNVEFLISLKRVSGQILVSLKQETRFPLIFVSPI